MTRHVLYLHGFASSARSAKASYFGERLAGHGVRFRCPDLNEPDFRSLTMTRMLGQVEREVSAAGNGSVTLIGSSLGGTLAILSAARLGPKIDRLVLLAPAVMFAKPGHHLFSAERVAQWKREGVLPIFHYADNSEHLLDYLFYEDSLRYNAFDAVFSQPTLIFQGMRDTAVDHRTVEAFASARRNVTLSLLDDDHQLLVSLPRIWNDTEAFLELID